MSQRSLSFGSEAKRYDRARPSYPRELVQRLLEGEPRSVLDVACGTGKAGRLFLEHGCEVLGVEPDKRMAALARAHGLTVEVARFEEWEPHGRVFDLIVCGQAWHWLDPEVALPKIAAVLHESGRFAAFWNLGRPDGELADAIDEIYRHTAPDFARENSSLFGAGGKRFVERYVQPLTESGDFRDASLWEFAWSRRYTRDEWLELLQTQSDHILLPPDRLTALLEQIGAAIDARRGAMQVPYRTDVVTALRA